MSRWTRSFLRRVNDCHQQRRAFAQVVAQATTAPASPTLSSTPSTAPGTTTRASTVDLLKRVRQLLRDYPLLEHTAWQDRTEQAIADVSSNKRRKLARIAIVGDTQSGITSLVTAALDDPLLSSSSSSSAAATNDQDTTSVCLAQRRLAPTAPDAIEISYSDTPTTTPNSVSVPVPWLRDNSIQLVEILARDSVPLHSTALSALYTADAVVILLSAFRLLASHHASTLLLSLAGRPNLIVAVNTQDAWHMDALESLKLQLDEVLPPSKRPDLLVVSTTQALAALEALRPTEPQHAPSFEVFQQEYLKSRVPQLKDTLARHVTASSPEQLHQQTAAWYLSSVITAAVSEAAVIENELESASTALNAMSSYLDTTEAQVKQTFQVESGAMPIPQRDVALSRGALDSLFGSRLAWYKLFWRIDDIATEVSSTVSNTYLRAFEESLIFHSGRLVSLASNVSSRTNALLASPSFRPSSSHALSSLHSPLLLNRVAQASNETRAISSADLTRPLALRRSQIGAHGGPIDVLVSRAQTALASSTILSGASVSAAALSEYGSYASLQTNVGLGVLGTAVGIMTLANGWRKAKKRFMKDVHERVTGGLEVDLATALDNAIQRATYKARVAVVGSQNILKKRRNEFDAFANELAKIERLRTGLPEPNAAAQVLDTADDTKTRRIEH